MRALKVITLATSATITATRTGAAVDLLLYEGVALIALNSSAMAAGSTTMDAKIQHSADGTTGWTDATVLVGAAAVTLAFAQVTNAAQVAQQLQVNKNDLKRFIRTVETMAGTTPSVSSGIQLIAKRKRV